MAWHVLVVAAALVSHHAPADGPRAGAQDDDLARLQGTWQLQSGVADGERLPPAECAKTRLIVKGRTLWYVEYEDGATDVRLNPGARPPMIDLTLAQASGRREEPVKGIYRLDGDRLTLCLAQPWRKRPTEFTSEAGSQRGLLIFRRVKR
jgi:uncharacterized protein (TIGR03067 family)